MTSRTSTGALGCQLIYLKESSKVSWKEFCLLIEDRERESSVYI